MASRFRQPFPWEDAPERPDPPPLDMARLVVIPGGGEAGGSSVQSGEYDGVRDSRAQLARQIVDATDGSPAAREWAAQKAQTAALNWDRGVRSGTIKRHR